MNILYYTILFVVLIGYVIASGEVIIDSEFRKAVDQGNLDSAVRIYEESKTYCGNAKYLVEKGPTEFVVKLAKRTSYKSHIVAALYTNGPKEIREEVFEKVSFKEHELVTAAENPSISCHPEHFLDLLGKITKPEYKYEAVIYSISGLFEEKRTECIDPLLKALKGKKDLENRAIRWILKWGIYYDNFWAERFYDHPAVTPDYYVEVLIELVRRKGTNDPIFRFLLMEADQDDLRSLLNDEDYKQLDDNILFAVDHAIEEALPKIKPAGFRPRTWEKAKQGKKEFDKITSGETEILGFSIHIAEYLAEKEE